MFSQVEWMLCRFNRVVLSFSIICLSASLLGALVLVQGQTDCSSYNQCPALQGEQNTKLTGNISYSFDNASLSAAFNNDQSKIDDFINRMTAAANDWAAQTGQTITPAAPGQTGNVTITVSGSAEARTANGFVAIDSNNGSRRIMTLSHEFNGFSAAGRDRLASHEWGHVLGLKDVGPSECPGVETVMRQLGRMQCLLMLN